MHWSAGVLLAAVVVSRCDTPKSSPPADSATPQPAAPSAVAPAAEAPPAAAQAAPANTSKAASLLADSALWGRDFAAALRALPAYESAGEQTVIVFEDRVVGNTRYEARSAAVAAASNVGRQLSAIRQREQAPMAPNGVLQSLPRPLRQLGTPVPMVLAEDRALHVGNAEPNLELLAPGLEITDVASRHGAAETTRTVAIDDGTERRPRILKLHSYDDGAIVFATNTGAVNPAAIERVILDAQRVSDAVQ